MPQKTKLNVPPYNDDFDINKEYYKVLFRPGYSIQSRELTTLQSILQNQIESLGRSKFKQGQQVIPGEVSFNNKLDYVKLASVSEVATNINGNIVFQKYDISQLVGFTIQGLTSGVRSTVLSYAYGNDLESDVLYVKYTNSGNSGTERTFRQGETLEALDILDTPTLVVGTDGSVLPTRIDVKDYETGEVTSIDSPAMGFASGVQVEEGVYFINGYFVNNFKELIVVDKYYNKPSVKVGFTINESIVNAEKDLTLFDNARGFSNFSAPGADRLKINLSLSAKEYDELVDDNYVQLIIVKNGEIQQLIKQNDYKIIEETLARRTYDESGDYVVENFPLDLREFYQRDGNKGLYSLNTETNLVNKKSISEAKSLMVSGIGPGKAYVKGFEIVNKDVKYYEVAKARDTLRKDNNLVKLSSLASFSISNVYNSVPLNSEGQELTAYPTIFLNNIFNDGTIGYNNTELPTDKKQTLQRRGRGYSIDDAIITLYLENPGSFASRTFPTDEEFGNSIKELWYIISLGASAGTTIVEKVELLSYSIIKRPEFNPNSPDIEYLELTVKGNKQNILFFMKEYDENDVLKRRKLFLSESDAKQFYFQAGSPTVFAYSHILDYNVPITPVIGVCKPKDFSLQELGSGFNQDLDIILSKGRGTNIGGISEIKVTNGGSGYTVAPSVQITGGGGAGAAATAVIENGVVTKINIIRSGSGYTSGPEVTFVDNAGTSTVSATAEAVFKSTYNSIFKLSYFNPIFFTKIIIDEPIASGTFTAGKYIIGATSGAYGIIEGSPSSKYSTENILMVRILSGNFVPGETITDEAGNSRRIAREGTISHFNVVRRGNGYTSSGSILKINGVAYNNSAIQIGFQAQSIYKVIVKDRNLVSQVYSTPPEVVVESNISVTEEVKIIPVLYRNTVYTYSPQNVKSLYSEFGYGGVSKFTADVESFNSKYINNKIITDFTFSGTAGSQYLECNGFSGDPSNDLAQGDIIQFIDESNIPIRSIVQRVEKPEGLIKSKIYLDNVLPRNVVNSSVVTVKPIIENSTNSSLILPTGSNYLNNVVQNTEDSRIKYYFRRDFVTIASTNGGNVTFAAQLPFGTQRFSRFTQNNFILTVLDKKSSTTLDTGDIIYLSEDNVEIVNSIDDESGLTAGSVTINLPISIFGTSTNFPILKLTATVEVSKARPRLKTIYRNKRILVISPGDRVIPLRGIDFDSENTDVLSYSDAIKVRYVYEGTVQTPPVVSSSGELVTGTDVTERFYFDDGQRDTFYDVSRLVLKPGFIPPSGQLVIAFDYFEQSQGDFCTVDSYTHESGVGLDEIPEFNSSVYGKLSLRDVFDFRPKVDTSTIVSGYQDTAILSVNDYSSFIGSGGVKSSTPATDRDLEYTVSFSSNQFLDRIDGVFLDKKGQFVIKEGTSSLNPTKPEDVNDAIPLYYLYIPSYTTNSNDVRIIPVDNRRYTMRDIGKLEKRIERLEYYTMLSVLEQQALNMQIKDDIGIDRLKSGFIVDGFENHGIGHLTSLDYKCSIDPQQSVLRPKAYESSFALEEVNTSEAQRKFAGYVNNSGVITLPYDNIETFGNVNATKTLNVNNFAVLQYVGDSRLFPNNDQWFDYDETPIILDNDSKVFSVFYAKNSSKEGFASIFNNYVVNWVGTNRVFYNVSSLKNIDSTISTSKSFNASTSSSSNISPQNNQLAQGVSSTTRGSNVVTTSIQPFCRSVAVYFLLTRLKPSSVFYAFMDGRSIDRWVAQDFRYTGVPGNSISFFNSGIKTDENGNASGIILIPSGLAPVNRTNWTGDVRTVQYDESSESLSFTTGVKTIKFTSNNEGKVDSTADSFTEVKYYAAGGFPEQPSSVISTAPAIFKGEEGLQQISNISSSIVIKPNPLSQTFKVEGFTGGLFVTSLDLYFNTKSSSIPIRTYISSVESGKPGKYIVPGSESVLLPDTYLRVYTNGTLNITQGEAATGAKSGASGPLNRILDRNNNLVTPSTTGVYTLNNDQIYTLVLSNHNGKSFQQDEEITFPSLVTFNAANATQLFVFTAKDSGRITRLNIKNIGSGYDTATLTIESPQLPGGTNAIATCLVSSGNIYEVDIVVSGSGYTEPPSVIINGTGSSVSQSQIEAILTYDTPAVRMGVAVDFDNPSKESTIPTKFIFEHPVYLKNDTEYAIVIETDSSDYNIWASRLGELERSTNTVVSSQPFLGSVFKSQNADDWTEDLLEDIKFSLYRAKFIRNRSAIVDLTNEPLGYELLDINPIETDSLANTDATSSLFRNNNKIVKISHIINGFEDSGKSYVNFRNSPDVGGISSDILNKTLFQVINSGNEFYNINAGLNAASNQIGGGNRILTSYNRKYEKLYTQISSLNFSDTKIEAKVKTTNIVPIDGRNVTYSSYTHSQTDDNGFEKTFINQEHYFNNQKVLASKINELKNASTIDNRSLTYRLSLSSENENLSPVVDLRSSSIKIINNYIEKSVGTENRYGRRDQIISFYPIYRFFVIGNNTSTIAVGDGASPAFVTGSTSRSKGIIVKFDNTNSELFVKVITDTIFSPSETLIFETQPNLNDIRVTSTGLTEVPLNFIVNSFITALDKTDLTKQYSNVISGRVIKWDGQKKQLQVSNSKNPINNNFISASITGSDYARIPFSSNSTQQPDIFRVNDLITYENQPSDTKLFLQVKKIDYTEGVLFVKESDNNSSSIAKYLTKEINLQNPSTSIDVRLTANIFEEDDIQVLYKIKPASSQFNFDDLSWEYFNGDGGPDVRVIPSSENSVASYIENQNSYKEYKFSVSNLNNFSSFAIKVIMRSSNPVFPPKIQDIRAVASF